MTLSAEMKLLAEDIIKSFEARMGFINALVKETRGMLASLKKEQTGMAREIKKRAVALKKGLKAGEENRIQESRAFLAGLKESDMERRQEQDEMENRVRGMLAEFNAELSQVRADNRRMAEAWRKMSSKLAEKRHGRPAAHLKRAA